MTKKYLVKPGHVYSQVDGQKHYITVLDLMQLYGVKPEECIIFNPGLPWQNKIHQYRDLLLLVPRPKGDYNLENCNVF